MFNFLLQGKVGEMMAPIKSPEAQLLIAIQNGQRDKIRELLEVQGVGANFANDRGVRPMHMACQSGDMALVQRLLELGADIVTADKAGNTPLHYAAKGGHMEMVKMLVGQGAGVEKRNATRLTAYDVATDHVIRQFLLPLQLKAEAGNPEYAVHTMGITTDGPRNFEQYGAPGLVPPVAHHGQFHHQQSNTAPSNTNPMSAALGALMQAPNMVPPRPAAAYGSYTGPGHVAGGGNAVPPPPPAVTSTSTPFPGATNTSSVGAPPVVSAFPLPSPVRGSATGTSKGGTATPIPQTEAPAAGESTQLAGPNPPPEVPGNSSPGAVIQEHLPAAEGGKKVPSPENVRSFGGASATVNPGAANLFPSESGKSTALGGDNAAGGGPQPSLESDMKTQPSEGKMDANLPQSGASVAFSGVESKPEVPVMAVVDLSSNFESHVAVAGVKPSLGVERAGAPVPSFPPHASVTPSRGHSTMMQPPPGPTPSTGESPGGFKPIKPDGFHSSASDKALQLRYGHTKILRDVGAPPTAAQLGAPPVGGPPMARPSNNGFGIGAAPPTPYTMPPPVYYGQPYGGSVGGQASVGVQPFGQTPPRPTAVAAAAAPGATGGQHVNPGASLSPRAGSMLPMPSAYSSRPSTFSHAGNVSGGVERGRNGGGGGSYTVFNPTTDKVVSADSNSSAVL